VILTLLAAVGFLAVLFGGGLLWMRILLPDLDVVDQVAAAPAVAVVYFSAVTATALIVPWSFTLQAALGMVLWVAGALVFGWTRARTGLGSGLRCRTRGEPLQLLPVPGMRNHLAPTDARGVGAGQAGGCRDRADRLA